ncbi:MAG: hypothetical protein EBS05_05635 [Proteobacteria bacterium]|nr:hypothetical protein [Pseudomonadota bacterium]
MGNQVPNHLETLALQPGASAEEIKRAYLTLVKRWHPDRFAHDPAQQKQAEERMKAINVAYEALVGEARPEVPFQRTTPAPAYDPEAADKSGREAYAHRERPTAFAFWRGQTGLMSWAGTIVLGLISLITFWFVADTVANYYAPPFAADSLRHEAKLEAVVARTRRAAEQGEPWAMFNVGSFYYNGRGVPANLAEAAKWFARAAQAGEPNAQSQLGLLYAKGTGVGQDYAAAASWFRAAAEQGQRDAQHNLALLHRSGLGVPVDFAEAFQWWSLATAAGHPAAGSLRDALVKEMTPQQLAEGQRRLQAAELRMPKRK